MKTLAKRRLSGRYGFCVALTAVWLLFALTSSNLTGSFLPMFPLGGPELQAFLEDPLSPFMAMEASQTAGWALAVLLLFIVRTPFSVGMAAVYLWLSKEDHDSVKPADPGQERDFDEPGWQVRGWKKLLPFYAAPGQWTRVLTAELIRAMLEFACMAPGVLCFLFAMYSTSEPVQIAMSLLSLILMGLAFVVSGAFAQTRYLLADPGITEKPAGVIWLSVRNMKGRLIHFAFFRASFLLWFAFMQATMLIGGLYVVPYYEMSVAIYIRKTWRS